MKAVSFDQRRVLDMISTWVSEHGYPPSYREISQAMGWDSPASAYRNVQELIRKGKLKKHGERMWRALELAEPKRCHKCGAVQP